MRNECDKLWFHVKSSNGKSPKIGNELYRLKQWHTDPCDCSIVGPKVYGVQWRSNEIEEGETIIFDYE